MSTPNPRRSLMRPRPALGNSNINTASSPSLGASYASPKRPPLPSPRAQPPSDANLKAASSLARKASYNKLTAGSLPDRSGGTSGYGLAPTKEEGSSPFGLNPGTPVITKMASGEGLGDAELEVGDIVEVPGGMDGTVKFIGEVAKKTGIFVGVELSSEWAIRGKNDGDVDGIRYFATSIPGSGIFLPIARAVKRPSPTSSAGSFPQTPNSPSVRNFNLGRDTESSAPTAKVSKFSQSVGPGRALSPALRPKNRPSLPRPESPLRKAQNASSTPTGRPSLNTPSLSKSLIGGSRYGGSHSPAKFGGSVRGKRDSLSGDPGKIAGNFSKPGPTTPANMRSPSRSQSRLGIESMFDEDDETAPIGIAKTVNGKSRPVSGQQDEVQVLKAKLGERDKQLKEQASSLADMEQSFTELQGLLPEGGTKNAPRRYKKSGYEDADVTQLRAMLREKNEKIVMLTAEFDSDRKAFRSTIDTLELASRETGRVYDRKIDGLLQEIQELQGRGDDVDNVAQQLKQLEVVVQELEDDLEDARRGEAEARGEVEFLRGEVERGRSELGQEREKVAVALKRAGAAVDSSVNLSGTPKEVEQRDDEIRGLKAIIHSLSRDSVSGALGDSRRGSRQKRQSTDQASGTNAEELLRERQAREQLEREVKELEGLVDRKTYREEELELEVDRLRKAAKHANPTGNSFAERSVMGAVMASMRSSPHTATKEPQLADVTRTQDQDAGTFNSGNQSQATDSNHLWCDMCETEGHEILTCTNMLENEAGSSYAESKESYAGSKESSPGSLRIGPDLAEKGLKGMATASSGHDNGVAPSSAGKRSPAATLQAQVSQPLDQNMVAGKESGTIDTNKWCALCERDGHESVDCPFDESGLS